MSRRDLALQIAFSFLGRKYLWGGNDPVAGFDCSGLVIECLRSVGLLPRSGDWTAHSLLNSVYKAKPRATKAADLRPGMLVFWPRADGHIRHVELVYAVVDGEALTIGASGGGSKTLSEADAVKQDAYVKIRPVNKGWSAAVDPF